MKRFSILMRKLSPAVVPAVAIAAVACGGLADTTGPPDSPTQSGQPPVSQVVNRTQPASPQTGGSPAELDADAVVAAFEEVLGRVHEEVLPSVVQIRLQQRVESQFPFGPQSQGELFSSGEGSGFVWDDRGYVVTNQHVVAGADRVIVVFHDDFEVEAQVVGADANSDLAVLKIDVPTSRLQPVRLGDSGSVRVGQLAIAIGNPFGQEFTTTSGIVSAVGRTIQSGNSPFSIPEVIQTDAPINPGNSGGPLLDRTGKVIGINTQIISRSGSSAGIGFAVPVNIAKKVVKSLIDNGEHRYAWLGVSGTTLGPEAAELLGLPRDTRGAHIIQVIDGSPAAAAGLVGSTGTRLVNGITVAVGGDVVVAVDGQPVTEMDDLIAYMVEHTSPGDEMTLQLLRKDGVSATVTVELGLRPPVG